VRRLLGGVGVGLACLLIGPLTGSTFTFAAVASAHAQLVSSSPGAGDVVPTAPTELRLVFSEPLEPRYSSVDLLDPVGRTVLLGVGTVDPSDDHVLAVRLDSPLANGSYTLNWRNVSAADGHSSSGFITFGVGQGASGGQGTGDEGGVGDLHSGHTGGAAIAEVEGKTVGYGGLMLVFGIALLTLLFGSVVPNARWSAANASWILLIVAASGSAVLIGVEASTLPSSSGGSGMDLVGYATGSRVGQLLLLRTVIALAAGAAAFGATRLGRNGLAIATGGTAAGVSLALVALGGHAAGFSSPVPILVDVVHLAAGSAWLAGVVGLFWLVEFGRLNPDHLRALVPRFSAVALVSVALIIGTGTYQAWIETHDFTSVATPYSLTLAAKVALFAVALAFGAVNYFDGGRDRGWLGGFRTRIFLEAGFAVAVVGLAANVTSGSPTSEGRPVEISQAVSTALPGSFDAALGVQPGRPGPNRYVVRLSVPPPDGSTVQLDLQRLDLDLGGTRLPLRPAATSSFGPAGQVFVADGGQLGEGTRWDAAVVVSDASGTELGRRRFTFGVGRDGITEGRALPALDPALGAGIALVGLGVAAVAFGLAGGRLPRAAAGASRLAMVSGGTIGGLVGALMLSGGPR
jgi:copper transport protein